MTPEKMFKSGLKDKQNICRTWTPSILCFKNLHYIFKPTLLLCSFWLLLGLVKVSLHKKWSFPLRISSVNVTKSSVSCGFGPQFPKDLVTYTEEILNGKLHFLCSVISIFQIIADMSLQLIFTTCILKSHVPCTYCLPGVSKDLKMLRTSHH